MTTTNLLRLLNSIGKSTFVRYYDQFADLRLSHEHVVATLPESYTLKSRNSRATHARRIFREGLQEEALELILHAEGVDDKTRCGASDRLDRIRATRS